MSGTLGDNATTFSGLGDEGILPAPMASKIITEAYGDSVVGRLAGNIPMPITGTSIAFQTGTPVAGIVGEGELKPVIKTGVATKTARPIKTAAVMYWSKEARQANPLGYLGMLEQTAKDAIRRSIDMAVLHGKNALTDGAISGVEAVAQTKNIVTLGTAAQDAGGLTADILGGYGIVVDGGGDFNAFAADARLRTKLMGAVDANGRPIYTSGGRGGVDLKDPMGDLLGLPVTYSKAVSGKLGVVADTGIRLMGGDFANNIQFGYVEQLTYRKTDVGTIVDGDVEVNLFQQNMEAFIVEAQFGWIIRDVDNFVVYKDAEAGA